MEVTSDHYHVWLPLPIEIANCNAPDHGEIQGIDAGISPRWRGQVDTFEFNEMLATPTTKITAVAKPPIPCAKLSLMPLTKPGDRFNRARQEIEESQARFEREAK